MFRQGTLPLAELIRSAVRDFMYEMLDDGGSFAHAPASHRAMFITAIFKGMRISELRGLTWDCVDFDRRVIKVSKRADEFGAMGAPKSRAGLRDIPMAPVVHQTLSAWRSEALENDLGLVFPNGAGRVQSPEEDVSLFEKLESDRLAA